MAHRNWARGSAPPADSWEWVGVEKPPQAPVKIPVKAPPSRRPGEAVVVSETITIVAEKKKPWPKLLLGGLLAAAFGYALGSRRS